MLLDGFPWPEGTDLMAKGDKFASIDAYFVLDPYVQTLNANDRWLYFVLLCNPDRSMIGIFEIGLPTLELYSGLGREAIGNSLDVFAQAGKIHYVDGWIIIKNYIKNNPIKDKAPGIIIGAHKRFMDLPWSIRERAVDPTDTLYIPYLDPTSNLYIGYTEDTHNLAVAYGSRSRAQAREHSTHADGSGLKGRPAAEETPLSRDIREARENSRKLANGELPL